MNTIEKMTLALKNIPDQDRYEPDNVFDDAEKIVRFVTMHLRDEFADPVVRAAIQSVLDDK